ncbi:MAG: ATP-binding protein, partial [Planctomycetota bacterium]
MTSPAFFSELARTLNSGQSRSVVLHGNVHDLFWNGDTYVPLIRYLHGKTNVGGLIRIVYELNGPIRVEADDADALRDAWVQWRTGMDVETLQLRDVSRREKQLEMRRDEYDRLIRGAIGNATQALEFLRQLTICSRAVLRQNLLIMIEAAEMLLPPGRGDYSSLPDHILRRIGIVSDWFSDPEFFGGEDSVVLIADSRSQLHPRVAMLPQVLDVEVPAPDLAERSAYLKYFLSSHHASADGNLPDEPTHQRGLQLWTDVDTVAMQCAGLSIHAMRQMLTHQEYTDGKLVADDVVSVVQRYIQTQLGEDVVEFKKPKHRLEDVVGFGNLKTFLRSTLIPRFKTSGDAALPGAAVAGPIGGGKTFIFEAVAAELDMPVLVLKSIRSQWFGQTDVIFERLRRVLESLDKVVIFVDEADTQFGGVGAGTHDTERRLTGKIQSMMSDPQLRGRVLWLLMTARINLLSPDIRRPGRVGDLIIPVLDPREDDRREFIRWMLGPT